MADRMALGPWRCAAICAASYYGLPLIAAAVGGVLISPVAAHTQFEPLGLTGLGSRLSAASGVTVHYATDVVHLMMSGLVLSGSALLFFTLRNLGRVVADLLESRKLAVTEGETADAFFRAGARYRGIIWRSVLVVVAVSLFVVIERKTHDPTLVIWWGHASHGLAGHLLAAAVGLMVLFGGSWLFLLACGLDALSELLKAPVRLEPLHPDGCNGFGKFGDYLISLFLLSVLIAATAWLCLWKGYLGVEHLAITWIAGAGGILVIPLILIKPLALCTRRIAAARLERMCNVHAVFDSELKRIEASSAEQDPQALGANLRRLFETQRAVRALYPSNVFPFKPKVAGTLSATYILQVALFLHEAFSKLAP